MGSRRPFLLSSVALFCLAQLAPHGSKASQPLEVKGSVTLPPKFNGGNADLGLELATEEKFDEVYEKLRTFGGDSGTGSGPSGFANLLKNKRLYNTSIAFTASMLSYYLPPRADPGTTVTLTNQIIYGLFGLLALVLIFALPTVLTGIQTSGLRSFGGGGEGSESWFSSNLVGMEQFHRVLNPKVRDEIGLDATKCLQKTICEAHRSPKNKKFGLLALPFQMFFPPPSADLKKARGLSEYETAAEDGKYAKEECSEKFRCFFDVLDVFSFLVDWYRLGNDPEYSLEEEDFDFN